MFNPPLYTWSIVQKASIPTLQRQHYLMVWKQHRYCFSVYSYRQRQGSPTDHPSHKISVYSAAQHFSFTPLSAALQQQWCVYGIYVPVCESSGGKTFLCFKAWKFRSYTGPDSENKEPAEEERGPRQRRRRAFHRRTQKIWCNSVAGQNTKEADWS